MENDKVHIIRHTTYTWNCPVCGEEVTSPEKEVERCTDLECSHCGYVLDWNDYVVS